MMKPSQYWEPLLKEKELQLKIHPLKNFRRTPLSTHLDDSNAYQFRGGALELRYTATIKLFWGLLPKNLRWLAIESECGEPVTLDHQGYRVTTSSIEFAYMTAMLEEHLPVGGGWPSGQVVEIGGGYGGLARAVKRLCPWFRYTIIDFPQIQEIQKFFLKNCDHPDHRFLSPEHMGLIPKGAGYPFTWYPVEWLEPGAEPVCEVDVFINTRSFMEMELSQVEQYIQMIEKKLRPGGVLYMVNRAEKVSKLADYPFDEKKWSRRVERAWPSGSHMREVIMTRSVKK